MFHKKISNFRVALFLFFLLTNLFISACSSSSPPPSKTQQSKKNAQGNEWLKKFFSDLLLEKSGIYTLWGSKPITSFEMCLYSMEELQELKSQIPDKEKGESIPAKCYNFPENWENWENFSRDLQLNRYLLFKKESYDDPKLPRIFFVNILKTAITLEENYSLFRRVVGHDFDSLEIVFEITDDHSKFWNEVFQSSYLMGILYGFGKENSLCFHWKFRKKNGVSKRFTETLQYHFSDEVSCIGNATISAFPLPIFSSFFADDKVIDNYKKEREEIIKRYGSEDFVELSLKKLTE